MNIQDVKKLVQQGESSVVEFKTTTKTIKAACKTICAFLNMDGGIVLIGVTDNGDIIGQDISDKTKREIGNEIAKIAPVATVDVIYIELHNTGKFIICLCAKPNIKQQPYTYDHRAFLRTQSNTIIMPREYYQQLIMSNAPIDQCWEDQFQQSASINDLDEKEILATVQEGVLNGRIPSD